MYECAYCESDCILIDEVLTKWGFAYRYECKSHGMYYVFDTPNSPMRRRGEYISPII